MPAVIPHESKDWTGIATYLANEGRENIRVGSMQNAKQSMKDGDLSMGRRRI